MVEDGVLELWRRYGLRGGMRERGKEKEEGKKGKEETPGWARWLGYVWVLLFLSWSTPVWAYPSVRRAGSGPNERVLRYSVVAWLTGKE